MQERSIEVILGRGRTLSVPVRNETRNKFIVVSPDDVRHHMATSHQDIRQIVNISHEIEPLRDSEKMAQLMSQKREFTLNKDLIEAWTGAALDLIEEYFDANSLMKSGVVWAQMRRGVTVVKRRLIDDADIPEWDFERKFISPDENIKKEIYSVCPVTGIGREWFKTAREAIFQMRSNCN